ncbi:MAG: cation diffusion facilitator family transporter [Brooklawnia sp.]|uniref:cation diffusion facilitator family transporter n=1 Tax=Brooklawnia sp. TaxID=2699740 RepID=UPI003C743FAE
MNHSHGQVPVTGHVGIRYRRRMLVSFALVAMFMVVELVFGFLSGSLALISDAGHMMADVVALGAALLATTIAARSTSDGRRTYGSYRVEVFAAGLTVLIMLGVAIYVVVEGFSRLGNGDAVATTPMVIVGALGLAVNVVVMLLLREGAKSSVNVKAAYFEVIADAAGSVGVLLAGALIVLTGSTIWDTVVALAIGTFVGVRAVVLGRQVMAILGQEAPHTISLDKVTGDLAAVPGVTEVHDLHLWTLTSGMHVATAHLVVDADSPAQEVLTRAQEVLESRHGIEHATLQTESGPTRQCQLDW